MASPAPSPGRPLEAGGDLRSRGMTVLDRIRAYRPARPCLRRRIVRHPNRAAGRIPVEPTRRIDMRLFAGIAAAAILAAGCGSTSAAPTPSLTSSPAPTIAKVVKAVLKASDEHAPITDAVS